ncbi:MAG: class I SAM-dependent methyltransferase [Deltaproteobacteria bacterium]|nr:class I SAM-dependent methyltransferase [Deltaproteobacteria bacterium]
MTEAHPSLPHLTRHQRDLASYKTNVSRSAEARFGPAWWGAWEQHLSLEPDATIVDLGAGPGTLLSLLRGRLPRARLIGVELQPELLAMGLARTEGLDVALIQADLGEPLPLPEAFADVVVSTLTLHELPYPPALLTAARRALRPGGRLVLYDVVRRPLETYLRDKAMSPDLLDHFREHSLFTSEDLTWLVMEAGFEVQEVVGRHGGQFAMIFATRGP